MCYQKKEISITDLEDKSGVILFLQDLRGQSIDQDYHLRILDVI